MASDRVSSRLPTCIGVVSSRLMRAVSLLAGSPALLYRQFDLALQSVRKACRFCSKPTSCPRRLSLAFTAGSTTPSNERART